MAAMTIEPTKHIKKAVRRTEEGKKMQKEAE